ncbi:hypothetical protein D3C85_978600 [compost metagenome]
MAVVTGVKLAAITSGTGRMPVTVLVSPLTVLSTSVSLVNTLPTASLPGVPLNTPPASAAVPLSFTPTGVSLAPSMVTVRVAVAVAPARSLAT